MAEFISQIEISNFKSIRSAKVRNCRRINLFIGRPNVGKSNILEALSLFTVPYLNFQPRQLERLVRCESLSELFYGGSYEETAYVETNLGSVQLMLDKIDDLDLKFVDPTATTVEHYYFDERLKMGRNGKASGVLPRIKKYTFATGFENQDVKMHYLLPPYGDNLYRVIELNPDLKKEFQALFREYQLELTFDRASQSLKVLKRNKEGTIFLIPYHSIADTLQRIIFYKTAIASNKDSVLLFEEPEAHSFPPYITKITQEMIYNRSNQYFVATHSPFILNDLLENAGAELSVYLVDYKNQETKIKHLNDKTMHDISQSGVDLFTNWETFA